MRKKLRATVTVTAKLSPQLAEEFYKIVNSEFEGNASAATREAIKLLIRQYEVPRKSDPLIHAST